MELTIYNHTEYFINQYLTRHYTIDDNNILSVNGDTLIPYNVIFDELSSVLGFNGGEITYGFNSWLTNGQVNINQYMLASNHQEMINDCATTLGIDVVAELENTLVEELNNAIHQEVITHTLAMSGSTQDCSIIYNGGITGTTSNDVWWD